MGLALGQVQVQLVTPAGPPMHIPSLGNPNRGRGYCKEHLHRPDAELGVGVAISVRAGECGTHWRNSVSEGI